MTKVYKLNAAQRGVDTMFGWLTRAGMGARYRHILTVPGRVTRTPRSTPVDVIEVDGQRWLVAPYGVTNWVRNVWVHPEVSLRRGPRTELMLAESVPADEAVPVIRAYIRQVPVTRPYWNVGAQSSDADINAAVSGHPVFRLRPLPAHSSESAQA